MNVRWQKSVFSDRNKKGVDDIKEEVYFKDTDKTSKGGRKNEKHSKNLKCINDCGNADYICAVGCCRGFF